MSESLKAGQCSREEYEHAKTAGLLFTAQGTNAFDAALGKFAAAVRKDAHVELVEALSAFSSAVWSDSRLPGDLRKELESIYHTMVVPAIRAAKEGEA